MATYDVAASRLLSCSAEAAYDAVLGLPLEQLLGRRAWIIPPVRRTEGPVEPWGVVGQSRTIVLGDGGRLLETLVAADRPADYRYLLTDVRGPMGPMVREIEGRFAFEPVDPESTRVTWSWLLHLRSPAVRVLMPVLAASWQRAAAHAFDEIAAHTA